MEECLIHSSTFGKFNLQFREDRLTVPYLRHQASIHEMNPLDMFSSLKYSLSKADTSRDANKAFRCSTSVPKSRFPFEGIINQLAGMGIKFEDEIQGLWLLGTLPDMTR
ncbi:hypothetical protein Tco_0578846, partial [Tanacetum coccineum]